VGVLQSEHWEYPTIPRHSQSLLPTLAQYHVSELAIAKTPLVVKYS
jgi:hypothetical protein